MLTGATCQSKPDAYTCTFIVEDPIDLSYSYCVNLKTNAVRVVNVKLMNKYITTDPESYSVMRDWYKNQCQ